MFSQFQNILFTYSLSLNKGNSGGLATTFVVMVNRFLPLPLHFDFDLSFNSLKLQQKNTKLLKQ